MSEKPVRLMVKFWAKRRQEDIEFHNRVIAYLNDPENAPFPIGP